MNIRRMRAAIRFMRTVPRKHFYMGWWVSEGVPERNLTTKDLKTCGTTACAAGWLGTLPSYHRAGIAITGKFGGDIDTGKLQKHLGLDYIQFHNLFVNSSEALATPKQWARLAENMVKEQEHGR